MHRSIGVPAHTAHMYAAAQVGQRVVAASWPGHQHQPPANGRPFGTFQQYLPVPEADLLAVPDQLDDETAAQLFVSSADCGITAAPSAGDRGISSQGQLLLRRRLVSGHLVVHVGNQMLTNGMCFRRSIRQQHLPCWTRLMPHRASGSSRRVSQRAFWQHADESLQ